MATRRFYTDIQIKSDIILSNEAVNTVPVFDGSKKIKSSPVTSTELGALTGINSNIQAQISAEILARSTADSALSARISSLEALDPMEYKGNYDASTNTPALLDGIGGNGDVYRVSVAGTQDLGSGPISFNVGDKVVCNPDLVYEKWDTQDEVVSVNGFAGAVVLKSSNIDRADDSESVEASLITLETEVEAAQAAADAAQASVDAHLNDVGDAHDASAISYVNTDSDLSAVNVQSAIDELAAKEVVGDIGHKVYLMANNQSVPSDITDFVFSNAGVRSFEALASVEISAAADLYETYKLHGIQRGSDWVLSCESTGDVSGVEFSITNAGQVQYISSDVVGFIAGTIKFRAIVTKV